jgi:hypothetical protein
MKYTLIVILIGYSIGSPAIQEIFAHPHPEPEEEPVVQIIRPPQSPIEAHFSYEAMNLVPPDYAKRALSPITPGSRVKIAATIFNVNPAGAAIFRNPALYDYRWFHNDRFISGGRGLSAITIDVGRRARLEQTVRLQINDNRGNFVLSALIELPLAQPLVTVFRQRDVATALSESALIAEPNSTITLIAQPYFFSRGDPFLLDFSWEHQGMPIVGQAESPNVLIVTVPNIVGETRFEFSALVSDMDDPQEHAQRNFDIIVQ